MKLGSGQDPPFRVREICRWCAEPLDLAADPSLAVPYLSMLVIPLAMLRRQNILVPATFDFPAHGIDIDE